MCQLFNTENDTTVTLSHCHSMYTVDGKAVQYLAIIWSRTCCGLFTTL